MTAMEKADGPAIAVVDKVPFVVNQGQSFKMTIMLKGG